MLSDYVKKRASYLSQLGLDDSLTQFLPRCYTDVAIAPSRGWAKAAQIAGLRSALVDSEKHIGLVRVFNKEIVAAMRSAPEELQRETWKEELGWALLNILGFALLFLIALGIHHIFFS